MESESAHTTVNAGRPSAYEPYYIKIILLITAITYLGTLKFDFVYDDFPQIVYNPFLRAWRYAPQFFISSVWKQVSPTSPGNYYRPMFLFLFRVCYAAFGDKEMWWHAVTLALHLLVTWLVYVLVKKMTGQFTTAWLSALIFGVHPMHHEVVAWVSATTESLFAVMFLVAFVAYLKSREGSKAIWTTVSCIFYILALLSKETAIILPVLAFAYDWIQSAPEGDATNRSLGERFKTAIAPAVWFAPIAILYLLVRNKILSGLGHSFGNASVGTWLMTLPSILFFYVRNWFYPVHLSESYDLFYQTRLSFEHVLLPALILVPLIAAVWMSRKQLGAKAVDLAMVWLVIPLLPALDTFVFRSDELVHDRYFYVPSIGASMLVALIIERFAKSQSQLFGQPKRVIVAALALTIPLAFLGVRAAGVWIDDYTLFTNAHKIAPRNATAANNLSAEMMSRQELSGAQAILESGYQSDPSDFRFTFNLGRLYYRQGDYGKAEKFIARTLELDPVMADAYVTMGQIQLKRNHLADAQKSLHQAVVINPYSAPFHTIYGISLAIAGDCPAANEQYKAALILSPGDALTQVQAFHCRMGQPASPPAASASKTAQP